VKPAGMVGLRTEFTVLSGKSVILQSIQRGGTEFAVFSGKSVILQSIQRGMTEFMHVVGSNA
jgi:hypothetical protein